MALPRTCNSIRCGFLTSEWWGFVLLGVVLWASFPADAATATQFVIAFSAWCFAYSILSAGRSHLKAKAAGKTELIDGDLGKVTVRSDGDQKSVTVNA